MKLRLLHILSILLALLAAGCRDSRTSDLLTRADAVMESAPDSARALLKSLDSITIRNEGDRAYYALLRTQADIKLDTPIGSDSLISMATEYYASTASRSFDRMRALFYHSQVLNGLGNTARSLALMLPAYELAKSHGDPYWIAKTSEQMGFLYDGLYNDSLSEKYSRESAYHYLKAGKELNYRYALADIIPTLQGQGRHDDAINLGDSLLAVLSDSGDDVYLADYILRKQLPAYVDAGRYDEGFDCLRRLEEKDVQGGGKTRQCLYSAQLMTAIGRYDDARGYLEMAAQAIGTMEEQSLLYHTLGLYYRATGQLGNALAMNDSVSALQSQFINSILGSSVAVEEGDFYHEEAMLQQARSGLWRNRLYSWIAIAVLVVAIGGYIYRQNLLKKERQLKWDRERLEEAAEQLVQLTRLSTTLRDDLDAREKSLAELNMQIHALDEEREELTARLEESTVREEVVPARLRQLSFESIFERQVRIINKICTEYQKLAKPKGKGEGNPLAIHYNNIQTVLRNSFSAKFLKELERQVNHDKANVVARLRHSGIPMTGEDMMVVVMENAGFSVQVVATVLGCSGSAVYKRKNNMLDRIKESGSVDKEEFIALLGLKGH